MGGAPGNRFKIFYAIKQVHFSFWSGNKKKLEEFKDCKVVPEITDIDNI